MPSQSISTIFQQIFAILTVSFFAMFVARIVVRVLMNPVALLPGPWYTKYTNIWRVGAALFGIPHTARLYLHRTYGSVCRTGPFNVMLLEPSLMQAALEMPKDSLYDTLNFFRGMSNLL